jgi:hypothetical protein
LAVLGAIASIEVSAGSEAASEVAAGHMRLVAGISEDRDAVFTLEISEPVLALAAHDLLRKDEFPWAKLLIKFAAAAVRSSTSVGYRGEVAGQILLLTASQKCMLSLEHDRGYVEADVFFQALFGKQLVAKLAELGGAETKEGIAFNKQVDDILKALKGGYVRLYQVCKSFEDVDMEMLFQHFLRGSGIYCKEYHEAIDIALTIYFPRELSDPLSKLRMSVFLIQIKLRSTPLSEAARRVWRDSVRNLKLVKHELNPELPFFAICLELGPAASKRKTIDIDVMDRIPYMGVKRSQPEDSAASVGAIVVFSQGLGVEDIVDKPSEDLVSAFNRILMPFADPCTFECIRADNHAQIREMFSCQPYNIS